MPLNVLVVEDAENDALLAILRLEGAGWDVNWERAATREQLEAALDERRWDVLLVDYVLPGFGGAEALALVGNRGLDCPFIIVSGKIGEEAAVEAMHAGAHDFVSKDNLTRLPAVVARELRDAESRREHRHAEEAMQLQAAALRAAANAVLITDADGHIEWVNRAFTALTGRAEEEVLGEKRELMMAPDAAAVDAEKERAAALAAGQAWSGELILSRKDGSPVTVLETATPLTDAGRVSRVIVIQEDITRQLADEARIEHLAHHDPLTDLPDRMLLRQRLEQACAHSRQGDRAIAVVGVDLDRFKTINEIHGRSFGDAVLRAVAGRLRAHLRITDTVSRVGSDEFVALLLNLGRAQDAARLTTKILAALAEPFTVDGKEVNLGASAGIAFFPPDRESVDEMLRAADIALGRAMQAGRGTYAFFSAEMGAEVNRRIALEEGLREALDGDALLVEYHPEVDAQTGRILAVEALVRWGTASPAELAAAAESSGLGMRLDEWVLRRACSDAAGRRQAGTEVVRLTVNICASDLREGDLVRMVERVLRETDLPADALELEFTERALERDVDDTGRVLTQLSDVGVHLSIDEFGTGYSSLGLLSSMPVERLKIDRSFVDGIGVDARKEDVVRTAIGLAHGFGMRAAAEGVEISGQLDFLRANDCDEVQGVLVGQPGSLQGSDASLQV